MNEATAPAELPPPIPLDHGSRVLPAVTVDTYNEELRDDEGFVGDRASRRAFRAILADWRDRLKEHGDDPFGDTPMEEISKSKLDKMMESEDPVKAALVHTVVEEFAGELAMGRASIILRGEGLSVELRSITNHPDEAGLIGAVQLAPSWIMAGHDAILAVDIGGTNARVGVVELNAGKGGSVEEADVWKRQHWRHFDDKPTRDAAVERIASMLEKLIDRATD